MAVGASSLTAGPAPATSPTATNPTAAISPKTNFKNSRRIFSQRPRFPTVVPILTVTGRL